MGRQLLVAATLGLVVVALAGAIVLLRGSPASPVGAAAKVPLYKIEVLESFACTKNREFCEAVIPYEGDAINHESAVLYSDGTGHEEFTLHCREGQEPFCEAGTTAHISQDFRWFIAQTDCGDEGCVPLQGPCTPSEFQTCTPYFWRDKPNTWTFRGCAELSEDFILTCARRGSPPVTLSDPVEVFGGFYPDLTFWPAVPGHYTFTGEPFGGCFDFPLKRCPPPGITVQYQIVQLP